eukprot:4426253-Prymnesium_polylepis.1
MPMHTGSGHPCSLTTLPLLLPATHLSQNAHVQRRRERRRAGASGHRAVSRCGASANAQRQKAYAVWCARM